MQYWKKYQQKSLMMVYISPPASDLFKGHFSTVIFLPALPTGWQVADRLVHFVLWQKNRNL